MRSEGPKLFLNRGDQLLQPTTRRRFLGALGMGGAIVLLPSVFSACARDTTITDPRANRAALRDHHAGDGGFTLDLSTDIGILNYAYALEQLEAAFYTAALTSAGYRQLYHVEREVFMDLQKHEVIHREFFKEVLGLAAIPDISFDDGTVASLTADSDVLLRTSQLLEDTGVSAYNGAGKYLTHPENLLVAGKIVSVEARHAAAIRDIRDGTNGVLFAGDDVVNEAGLDVKAEPDTVVAGVVSLNVVTSPLSIGTLPDQSKRTADQPAPAPV
ncbi:MAG TPA: ferritin-like domain-containing protein [Gemmatimonadaceae bacterium]|nr:ferritin-like domain-containing protein [Gemmatimonadaceae bacterium]